MTHPVDVLVGQRIRQRRSLLGMTARQLGDRLGLTCQQIQNFEAGADRVSSRRIWDIAAAMDVPVLFFFDGLDGRPINAREAGSDVFANKGTLNQVRT